ncbi:MAG: MBL fold metallo-hydrolase [Patescibacteria group bacterium]|nr:MBL fold metallo-hydrolase [Patescibacteria group bacterium]
MKITKYGHCCMYIEVDGVRVLTDPGNFENAGMGADPKIFRYLDAVIITHEHQDHFHLPSLSVVMANNREAKVYTTASVKALMAAEGRNAEVLEDGQTITVKNVPLTGVGKEHAEIYGDFNRPPTTGVLIANQFFYPGDAFTNPGVPVKILALPIAGPWMKIKEAIAYVLALKPQYAFPVHDGMLKTAAAQHKTLTAALTPAKIEFRPAELGVAMEFT